MWLVLPPLATVLLIVAVYQRGYESEDGTRAGAEPVMAGIFVALPFVVLMGVEGIAALAAWECESWTSLTGCLVAVSLGAVAIGALSLWLYRYGLDVSDSYYLSAAILLPLAPAWLSHLRDRPNLISVDTLPNEGEQGAQADGDLSGDDR